MICLWEVFTSHKTISMWKIIIKHEKAYQITKAILVMFKMFYFHNAKQQLFY